MEKPLAITDLLNIKWLQKIQDNFSTITDIGIRIIDPCGNTITSHTKEPKVCSGLFKDPRLKNKIGGPCLPTFLGGDKVIDKNLSFICEASLHHFIAPLLLNKKHLLAYIIVGPLILVMRKPKEEYRPIAEKLNIDLEDFWNALLEIRTISFHGAQSITELIRDVGEYTIMLAYRNKLTRPEEEAAKGDSSQLTKLLDTLLDVAFEISGADVGSIMILNKTKNNLTIQTSRGLPDEIVKRTRVELGDRISGLSLKEKRPFCIVGDISPDNRLRSYLKRPYLTSSIVVPFEMENKVSGVINLGTSQASPTRLNTDSLKLLNKLINLTTTAIR